MKYVHQGFENEKFMELKRQKGREPWWKVITLGCEVIAGARAKAGETAIVTVKASEGKGGAPSAKCEGCAKFITDFENEKYGRMCQECAVRGHAGVKKAPPKIPFEGVLH